MKYTEEMILRSQSGYCMPFEAEDGKDVQMSLGYGKQEHPTTGETFFHHGIDFTIRHRPLAALATGTVSAVGSDATHGIYQTIRYGKYEVTYRHLSNVFANFCQPVRAGQTVAVSGDMLHMEARFDGEELNPLEFLTMLYGNVRATERSGGMITDPIQSEARFSTPYDSDQKEIENLLVKFLPNYFDDLQQGYYTLPEHTEQSLRNTFSQAAARNYFFETMPSMQNPLGIGMRSMPLAAKIQAMLIGDFLSYLALRHGIILPTTNEEVKKKSVSKQ